MACVRMLFCIGFIIHRIANNKGETKTWSNKRTKEIGRIRKSCFQLNKDY